jgi:hypothetical protein
MGFSVYESAAALLLLAHRLSFVHLRHVDLEFRGPYAVLADPIYGLGQLAAYGSALALASPIGLLAAALNQIGLYAFNAMVERPHSSAASHISTEWSLRDELSHTVLDSRAPLHSQPR